MKPIFWVIVCILLSPIVTCALLAGTDLPPATLDDWGQFTESVKGMSGISSLGMSGALVQFLLLIGRSHFMTLDGRQKIMMVQILSVVFGMLALRLQDFTWASAFLHANTLGAVQVFMHQLYKQFTDPGDRYEIPSK